MIAVVAVAYGSAAPQLGVAEFAPAARSELDAPPTTAGDQAAAGSARNHRRSTSTTVAPTSATTAPDGSAQPTAPTTRVGRTRSCVGNPPRQTDDPMSPPCVATIFEGDNGGATSAGVSGTEIRVAVPVYSGWSDRTAIITSLFDYINQSFEFYGRRLVPVVVSGGVRTALDSRALGATVASNDVFAALTGLAEWNRASVALPAELARRGIVTVTHGLGGAWSDRLLYDQFNPYAWSVYPSTEDVQANLADFSCQALEGRLASHADDPALRQQTRRFAILGLGWEAAPSTSSLATALAGCTGVDPLRFSWANPQGSAALRTSIERLKGDGATTVICVCETDASSTAMSTAHSLGFHPEWLLIPGFSSSGNDEHWLQSARENGQGGPPIRLGSGPRLLPIQARPWFGPMQAILAGTTDVYTVLGTAEFLYPDLLVLASGIQGAGPNLSASTFAAALLSATFPNPGAGQAPYWQPSAGFGPGDHSFYDDYNVGWWSDTAPALDVGLSPRTEGSWCYLDQAARYRVGSYPADADSKLFRSDLPCR